MIARGPATWRNWHERGSAGAGPGWNRLEAMLYSDAHLTDHITTGLGPYRIINVIPRPHAGLTPALVVRADFRLVPEPDMSRTDESSFHGADFFDELAALLSLSLGIRCRSGGLTRYWEGDGTDPMGWPIEFDHRPPYLPEGQRGTVIPRLTRTVALSDAVPFLQRFMETNATSAVSVIRAARLYQQAVWASDSDPNQAWIQLVSAIEVVAQDWKAAKISPLARLREAWPELAETLEAQGADHAGVVARMVAHLVKSQQRFLSFMENFLPDPSDERPKWERVNWEDMTSYLRMIYSYRSRALHAGTPFPEPMCEVPRAFDDGIPIERPLGLATGVPGASWLAGDTPMLLSTFEYITRGALLRWWRELAPA